MNEPERSSVDAALAAARVAVAQGQVRWPVIDGLSVAIAGVHHPRVEALVTSLGGSTNRCTGQASVWFTGLSAPAPQAALLNGMAIHANDFDDTHDAAIVHCMSVILPAAVAGSELAPSDKGRLAAGVAAGTELACNLALARGHYSGWHYTTLAGTMGAALACAVAAGASVEHCHTAVANAYVFAAGNKQAVLDSSLMKRLMPGFAAQNGVLAYQATTSGLDGVTGWLTGDYGLLQLFYDGDSRVEAVLGGTAPRISELSYKPYPACRFTHGAIEAATLLRARRGTPSIDDVDRVVVRYPALDRFGIVCRPYKRRGAQEMDAQFSTAYLVASALLFGEISFSSYTEERFADERIARLAEKTTVERVLPPGGQEDLGPIEVQLGGDVEHVPVVLGSVARPLTDADRGAKFATCLGRFDVDADVEQIDQVWQHLTDAVESMSSGLTDVAVRDLVRRRLIP